MKNINISILFLLFFLSCNIPTDKGSNKLTINDSIIKVDTVIKEKDKKNRVQKKEEKVHYNTSIDYKNLPKSLDDGCILANKIRKRILDFINLDDENLYNKTFLELIEKNSLINSNCRYPRNVEDISLYYYIGEEILLNKAKKDSRATKLILDLYINNKNNVEFSQFYTFVILQKLVLIDLESFIKVISKYDEKNKKKCIGVFGYIKDTTEIKEIKGQLNNPDYNYNQAIKEKILNKLK